MADDLDSHLCSLLRSVVAVATSVYFQKEKRVNIQIAADVSIIV
jgi:hypothetical protein